MSERTLIIFKPDAVKRSLIGEVFQRFEKAGLKMVAGKFTLADRELVEKHYPDTQEWKQTVGQRTVEECQKYRINLMANIGTADPVKVGEIVKKWNVDFLTSGPVLAVIFEGVNAVEKGRNLVGATVPIKAAAGTIRGDYSLDSAIVANQKGRTIYNLVHASGSVEEAETEIKLWFKPGEIYDYKLVYEDLYKY